MSVLPAPLASQEKTADPLPLIIETIINAAQPEQIILFGSQARGTARSGSDYDILVIVRAVKNERDVSRRIYRALLDRRVSVAVDVLVVSEDTLAQSGHRPYFVYQQALAEGQVLYGPARDR